MNRYKKEWFSNLKGDILAGIVVFMAQIPVVELAPVMLIVSITTINWQFLKRIRIVPLKDSYVMIVTVIIVVLTHNLAYGVVTGTILSLLLAGLNKSSLSIEKVMTDCTTYVVRGRLYSCSCH